MNEERTRPARVVEDSREAIKEIARQIRANPVTVEVDNGAVSATALANGQLTGVHISAGAQRSYDNQTLSELVLSAVQQATRKAVEAEFGGLQVATDGRASSLNDIFGDAIDAIAAEIEEEDRREQKDANRWSSPYAGRRPARNGSPDPLNPYGQGR
ncbi:MAG: hypothetical protein GEV03_02380 [Streptosporangiales bacterium]|nr:hypothetical protein [Streptosporangiales bacterium]